MAKFRMHALWANNVLEVFQQRAMINLTPAYQRLSVWTIEQQRRFIDSVINGMVIPRLYFHMITQPALGARHRYSVIDGKQRLLALWGFIENKIPLPSDFIFFDNESIKAGGLFYDELLTKFPILRAKFDGFEVPVILMETEDDHFIEQLFERLNIQMPLTGPEQRNAKGGPLPLIIRQIALKPFFTESVRITNKRYGHLDLAAKFLYITHTDGFVSTKRVILNKFVADFKQARDNSNAMASDHALTELESNTQLILEKMRSFFGERSDLLSSAGRCTLYFHIFRLCEGHGTDVPFDLKTLQQFNFEVGDARRKSQRMSRGSPETLTELEQDLNSFDREKQSLNDGGALERQYDYLSKYMRTEHGIRLPARG